MVLGIQRCLKGPQAHSHVRIFAIRRSQKLAYSLFAAKIYCVGVVRTHSRIIREKERHWWSLGKSCAGFLTLSPSREGSHGCTPAGKTQQHTRIASAQEAHQRLWPGQGFYWGWSHRDPLPSTFQISRPQKERCSA